MICPKCKLEVLPDMMVDKMCTGCVDGIYREGFKTRGQLYGIKIKHPYWNQKAKRK